MAHGRAGRGLKDLENAPLTSRDLRRANIAGRSRRRPLHPSRGACTISRNLDTQDARELSVITPGLLGPEYFRGIAEVLDAGGSPNVERIMEVMKRQGLRPALPAAWSTLRVPARVP